ncbi:hypothetical protein RI129_004841 [Pyrocoelia pectoralis]|uniref:Cytochrome P450 n=1 Tax=Pyrocoelia pectoralis TaxID=417401 RepID=A0AAN7VEP9_9COLE
MVFFEVCILIVTLAIFVTPFFQWRYTYWKRRNVTYLPPKFPFGNYENTFTRKYSFGEWAKIFYDEFKNRGVKQAGLYIFVIPVLLLIEPQYIKNVLQNDFGYFVNRGTYTNEKHDPLSANMFHIGGQKWRDLRTKLTPTFTSGKMKMMFNTVLQCTIPVQEIMAKHCLDNKPILIKEVIARFNTDVIGSCAFGLDCNSFKSEDSAFRYHGRNIFDTTGMWYRFRRGLITICPTVARALTISMLPKESRRFFLNVVKDTVKYRAENNIQRNDMLQILIELQKSNRNNGKLPLTIEEMAAQAFVFFTAGFETSSSVMSFCLYKLAENMAIQDKVREEIDSILRKYDGKINYDSIIDMKYMDQVINETMRLYPSLTTLTRECVKNYSVPDTNVVIEKNTLVVIPVLGLHKDPTYFKDPEKFDPERFSAENIHKIKPFTYLPFGEGPRMCIGMRFGMMQMKVVLTCLLRDYSFSVNSRTKTPVLDKYAFVSSSQDPIWLDVKNI